MGVGSLLIWALVCTLMCGAVGGTPPFLEGKRETEIELQGDTHIPLALSVQ